MNPNKPYHFIEKEKLYYLPSLIEVIFAVIKIFQSQNDTDCQPKNYYGFLIARSCKLLSFSLHPLRTIYGPMMVKIDQIKCDGHA